MKDTDATKGKMWFGRAHCPMPVDAISSAGGEDQDQRNFKRQRRSYNVEIEIIRMFMHMTPSTNHYVHEHKRHD